MMFEPNEIDNPSQPVNLMFAMDGPIFNDGLPLPITIKSLDSLQGIFDRTYLALTNRTRMSSQERDIFYIRSQGISRGSLLTTFGLIFTASQLVLPMAGQLGPTGIWEYTKSAYEFLRFVFEAKRHGDSISITQSGNNVSIINTGTQTIHVSNLVVQIANASLPKYERFAESLNPNRITSIRMGELSAPEIELNLEDANLFELPSTVNETPKRIECEIFEFDKYSKKGRLQLFEGDQIKPGRYKFSVTGNQDEVQYVEAMLERLVRAICLEEIVDHPLRGRIIARLQMLRVVR